MMKQLHKPDRTGVLVLVVAIVALYTALASLLTFLGLVSLPLGTLDNTSILVIGLLAILTVNLYVARERKRIRPLPK